MIKAIIFDMDGVLVSSEYKTFLLLQRLLREKGYNLPNTAYSLRLGKKINIFLDEYFGNSLSIDDKSSVLTDFYEHYLKYTKNYLVPIFETNRFLYNYKGNKKLALATVSSQKTVQIILKILGLTDRFNIILTSNDVVNFKPDPEIYLKVAKYLKVSPASCLVIEDSLVGCQASLGAGMKTYAFVHNKKMKKNFKNIQLDGFLETTSDIYRAIGESERI